MQHVTQIRLAEELGVGRYAISRAVRGPLAPAMVDKRIDRGHPAFVSWYASQRQKRAAKADRAPPPKTSSRPTTPDDDSPALAFTPPKDLLDMTVREVAERFGSGPAYLDYLKAHRLLIDSVRAEVATEKERLTLAIKSGEYMPREMVNVYCWGALEELAIRLLRDEPPTLALRTAAHFRSGGTHEEAVKIIKSHMSSHIRRARDKITRAIEAREAPDVEHSPELETL